MLIFVRYNIPTKSSFSGQALVRRCDQSTRFLVLHDTGNRALLRPFPLPRSGSRATGGVRAAGAGLAEEHAHLLADDRCLQPDLPISQTYRAQPDLPDVGLCICVFLYALISTYAEPISCWSTPLHITEISKLTPHAGQAMLKKMWTHSLCTTAMRTHLENPL